MAESFADLLKDYMRQLGCTASVLAKQSGLQKATLSRYLSGKRVPDPDSVVVARLAAGIAELSNGTLSQGEVRLSLAAATRKGDEHAAFPQQLAKVLDAFNIARNQLARSMDFDPSYISRILSGQRKPADLAAFVSGVADYVARNYYDTAGIAVAADLTGEPPDQLASPTALASAIRRFLDANNTNALPVPDATDAFLKKLDAFDLNDFLTQIHFDEIRVPKAPFQLPTTKTYEGIEQMKKAELDFLKAAVLSKSTDDVILYSDMPLEEMAADKEFPKKVMMGIALLIRKGVFLHNIHNVHRPLNEMFMGLEGWIPLYLTGQMRSYYLPYSTNDVFLHFIRSAGSVAVSGEAISGNQGGGRYVVTKSNADVAYLRRRAEELLALSRPLLSVYREDEARALANALKRLEAKAKSEPMQVGEETFRNMTITVWPESHAIIEMRDSPHVTLVVEHPALVDALANYEPMLFN